MAGEVARLAPVDGAPVSPQMAGDPLQDVQIDASVGHPCQSGVP
jgi:hypothetical protein